MGSILLLLIGLLSPWVVHLAPPRQRPLGLVAVVAAFLLYAIFVANPVLAWQMWAGLAAGIVSILGYVAISEGGGVRGARSRAVRRRPPRRPSPREDLTEGLE